MKLSNSLGALPPLLIALALGACKSDPGQYWDAGHAADAQGHDDAQGGTVDAGGQDAVAPPEDSGGGGQDAMTPAAGESCASATLLAPDMPKYDSTENPGGFTAAVCGRAETPQRFFSFVLPAETRATVTVTPTGDPWRAVVRVLRNCDATDCLTDDESETPGAPVRLVVDSPGQENLTKVVTVGSVGAGGAFEISLHLEPLGDGGGPPACGLPVIGALQVPNDRVTGMLSETGSVTRASCALHATSGSDAIYSLHLDERMALELRTDCGSIGCALAVRRSCDDASTEVACSSLHTYGGGPEIGLIRTVFEPGDYFVVIDAVNFGGTRSDYALTVSPFEPAPNYACETATPVSDGDVLRDQNFAGGGTPDLSCGADFYIGSETRSIGETLYYAAVVPAGYTLLIDLQRVLGNAGLRVILRGDCSPGSCLGRGPFPAPYAYTNDTGATQTVVFGIAPSLPVTMPTAFDLSVRVRPPAPNAVCAGAQRVSEGTLASEYTGTSSTVPTVCGLAGGGPGLYYVATVPPGEKLRVAADPLLTACVPQLRMLASCADTTCVDTPPVGVGGVTEYTNISATPQDVYIVVACDRPEAMSFDLRVALSPAM